MMIQKRTASSTVQTAQELLEFVTFGEERGGACNASYFCVHAWATKVRAVASVSGQLRK